MFYAFAVTIPANTAAASPVREHVELVPGTIRKVDIQFPRGCVGLVHAQVHQEHHQLYPTNPGADFASDGFNIIWEDEHELVDGQSRLTLVAWNLDDTFPHTLTFRFALTATPAADLALGGAPVPVPVLGTLEV